MKTNIFKTSLIALICCSLLTGCKDNSKNITSSASPTEKVIDTTIGEINPGDENMEIEYTTNEDGTYTCKALVP